MDWLNYLGQKILASCDGRWRIYCGRNRQRQPSYTLMRRDYPGFRQCGVFPTLQEAKDWAEGAGA